MRCSATTKRPDKLRFEASMGIGRSHASLFDLTYPGYDESTEADAGPDDRVFVSPVMRTDEDVFEELAKAYSQAGLARASIDGR